jgi:hypothetical protein
LMEGRTVGKDVWSHEAQHPPHCVGDMWEAAAVDLAVSAGR